MVMLLKIFAMRLSIIRYVYPTTHAFLVQHLYQTSLQQDIYNESYKLIVSLNPQASACV